MVIRVRRGIRIGILASLVACVFTGCNFVKQTDQTVSVRIGVTVYNQYDTFVSSLMEEFDRYASQKEEENGIEIVIETYNAADSQSNQNEQVEKMINDGCDVICVNLVDRTEPATIIDMAEKSDIPVIFFNRELAEGDLGRWDRLYYVGAKTFESGIMQGEIAADLFKNDEEADKNKDGVWQYIVLEGEAGHQDAIIRTEYAVSTIVENGVKVEKLGYAIANWDRAQAQTKMSHIIDQCGDSIELVIANNDDMALGAIDALKTLEIPQEEWPVIVGIDGTDVGLEAVINGEMAATVYNDKEGQAKGMLDLACQLCISGDTGSLTLEEGKYIRLPYAKVEPGAADSFLHHESSDNK